MPPGGSRFCTNWPAQPGKLPLFLPEGQTLKVVPNRHLRYFLDVPAGTAIPDEVFAAGEALEYGRHDYAAASRWFSDLANGSNGAVRAGALLRKARNEFRRNESSSALAAYAEMARLGSVTIEGEPAELVERFVRLGMLSGTVLAAETSALVDDLESGRWPLSRTSDEYYRAGLARFTRVQAAAPLWEDSIAALLDTSRQAGMESGGTGDLGSRLSASAPGMALPGGRCCRWLSPAGR